MLKPLKKLLINVQKSCKGSSSSGKAYKILPNSLLKKAVEVITELENGVHPQSLGAKKLRRLPNHYRMRINHSYRMLIGYKDKQWVSLGLYNRQSFSTLLNRRRR
jgi:radical S-adenosyl methionine domain-containing protein 2